MIKTMGKIVYYSFIGFLGVIALAIISTLFPIPGNFQVLVVQSGSMEPAIKTGGVVIIKPATEYSIGDVITFGPVTKTKPPTTHRITDVEVQSGNMLFVTKGDSNEDADPKAVAPKSILGKVLFSVPYFGYIVDFARKPIGFALIIGFPSLLIVGDEFRKIFVEAKRLIKDKRSQIS